MIKKLIIEANDIAALSEFLSKDPVRYKLQGFYVEKSLNNTANLVATCGCTLLCIRCSKGEAGVFEVTGKTKGVIIKPSNELIRMCKLKKSHIVYFDFKDQIAQIYNDKNDRIGVAMFEVIDDDYPDYKSVIPDNEDLESVDSISINTLLISRFAKSISYLGLGGSLANLTFFSKNGAIVVNTDSYRYLGLIMPCVQQYLLKNRLELFKES